MLAVVRAIKTVSRIVLALWLSTAARDGSGAPPRPQADTDVRSPVARVQRPGATDLAIATAARSSMADDESRDVVERIPDWRLEDGSCPSEDVDETDDGSADALEPPKHSPPTRSTGPGCRVAVGSSTLTCPRFLICGRLDC